MYTRVTMDIDLDDLMSELTTREKAELLHYISDDDIQAYYDENISSNRSTSDDPISTILYLINEHRTCYNKQDYREAFEELLSMANILGK